MGNLSGSPSAYVVARDRELIIEASLAGLSPVPDGFYRWSASELAAHADMLRMRLAGDSAAETEFRRRFSRLFEVAPKPFKPQYRSRRWPRPTIRNLIYHVCPLTANDLWRKNIAQLQRRLDVFNGRKIIAIATGTECCKAMVVRESLKDTGCEFLELPNDRELREVATFLPLLISVADPDPRQATFYAHTKGNSTDGSVEGSMYWRNAMYHHLLDRVDDCMEELETHACCGTHKMIWGLRGQGAPYPSGLNHGGWMLAGTFFWFRNDRVFNHHRWRHVPADRYGAEAWLSGLFHWSEAASVYQLWDEYEYPAPAPNPYDPSLYPDPIPDG